MAHYSGSIEQATTCWYETFLLFKKMSISGEMIWGFVYCKRTHIWDAGKTLTFRDYATKKDMFKLKLKGRA